MSKRKRSHKVQKVTNSAEISTQPKIEIQFTGHIELLSIGIDEEGGRHLKHRISSPSADGKTIRKIILVSLTELSRNPEVVIERLNFFGAHLFATKARNEYTNRVQVEGNLPSSFEVVTRTGLQRRSFVLPRRVISVGKIGFRRSFPNDRPERFEQFRVGGKFSDWLDIARSAKGNSRLMLSTALAFAGPVGTMLGGEQIGIQFAGGLGGDGKTSLLRAAGSVWGRHTDPGLAISVGFGSTWNATLHDIEGEAYAVNNTLLVLDESRAATTNQRQLAERVADAVMRWERGVQKGTMLVTARRRSWWVPLLSSSNIRLFKLAEKVPDVTIDAALLSRLIDIPLPAGGFGAFENLHGEADAASLAVRIIRITETNFGSPSRRFLRKLVEWRHRDEAGLKRWLRARVDQYLEKAKSIVSSRAAIARVNGKFSTIYAAGCLAIEFGALPWKTSELRKALLKCTRDHIAYIEPTAKHLAQAQTAPIDRLREHVRQHRAKFVDLTTEENFSTPSRDALKACRGYLYKHPDGQLEYLFSNEMFESIVGGSAAAKALKGELDEPGAIGKTAGTRWPRYSVKRPIGVKPNGKSGRCDVVAVLASVIDLK